MLYLQLFRPFHLMLKVKFIGEFMIKLIILFLISGSMLFSRDYTLDELLEGAVNSSGYSGSGKNYKQISEIEKKELFSNYYPQFNIDGQATYQSDVFDLPIKIPGMSLPTLRKDQYNINLNVQQLIWDGGAISANEKMSELSAEANVENSKAKVRNIIEQVGTLYYSALKIKSSIESIRTAVSTLESNKKQIHSLVENGVLVRSNLDAVDIQINSKNQILQSQNDDLQNILKSIRLLTGFDDLSDVSLSEIELNSIVNLKINRSEINALDKYSQLNLEKVSLFKTSLMPKFSVFARLGYGNPNQFNMFEQEWSDFYLAGIKMSWKPFAWSSEQRNSEIAILQNQNLDIEKKEFLRQINLQIDREEADLQKVESLLVQDKIILDLQRRIINDKYTQVLNGTATVSEYIIEINSLQQYEINMALHKIMLENTKSNILIKSGNYKGLNK